MFFVEIDENSFANNPSWDLPFEAILLFIPLPDQVAQPNPIKELLSSSLYCAEQALSTPVFWHTFYFGVWSSWTKNYKATNNGKPYTHHQ